MVFCNEIIFLLPIYKMNIYDKIALALFREKICDHINPNVRVNEADRKKLRKDCKEDNVKKQKLERVKHIFSNIKIELNSYIAKNPNPKYLKHYLTPTEIKEYKNMYVASKKPGPGLGLVLEDWGWGKNITKKTANSKSYGNVRVIARVKPIRLNNGTLFCDTDEGDYSNLVSKYELNKPLVTVKKGKNHDTVQTNCAKHPVYVALHGETIEEEIAGVMEKKKLIRDKNTFTKFHKAYDCIPDKDGKIATNQDIFKENILPELSTKENIFIAGYGQSGSGKSYLLMGDESVPSPTNPNPEKGLLEMILNRVMGNNVREVLFLPIQIYNGKAYNAFVGPPHVNLDELSNNKGWQKKTRDFFNGHTKLHGQRESYYRLAELNYKDMIDPNVPSENRIFPSHNKIKDTYDPYNINFPPVDLIFKTYFENSTTDFNLLNRGVKSSYRLEKDPSKLGKQIRDLVKERILRPVIEPETGLNAVSSRSHLFNIIRVEYNDGTTRLITLADFGGIEFSPDTKDRDSLTHIERTQLVGHDLKAFRQAVEFYVDKKDKIENSSDLIGLSKNRAGQLRSIITDGITESKQYYKTIEKNKSKVLSEGSLKAWKISEVYNTVEEKGSRRKIKELNKLNYIATYMQSSAIFNLIRATSSIFSGKPCKHFIFCMFHKYFSGKVDETAKCRTTGTVLTMSKKYFE